MPVQHVLSELYVAIPFGMYAMSQRHASSGPFAVYHHVSLGFYALYNVFIMCSRRLANKPIQRATALYIIHIAVCMTLASYVFGNDVWVLLLLRYVSWMFTFPFSIKMDLMVQYHDVMKVEEYSRPLMKWSTGVFALNILGHLYPHWVFRVFMYGLSAVFFWLYNQVQWGLDTVSWVDKKINLVWLTYGFVRVMHDMGWVDGTCVYIIFCFLDVFIKGSLVFSNAMYISNSMTHSYRLLKVARLLMPGLKRALGNRMIGQAEYDAFMMHMNVGACDQEAMMKDLLVELYPHGTMTRSVLSLENESVRHERLCVMFCDMVNYTPFVRDTPLDDVIDHVHDFYSRIDFIAHRWGVSKNEVIGDCCVIVSPDPRAVVGAAGAIVREFGDKVRIGVAMGPGASVTLGVTKLRHAYIGNVVNMAARMEATSTPGRIHVTEDVYEALEGAEGWEWEERGEVELKGLGKVRTWWGTCVEFKL